MATPSSFNDANDCEARLFSPGDTDYHSNTVTVGSGDAFAIRAWGLTEDDCIEVQHVGPDGECFEAVSGCGGCLNECTNVIYLRTAGTYRLCWVNGDPGVGTVHAYPTSPDSLPPQEDCMGCNSTIDPVTLAGTLGDPTVKAALGPCIATLLSDPTGATAVALKAMLIDLVQNDATVKTAIKGCVADAVATDVATQAGIDTHLQTSNASGAIVSGFQANPIACGNLANGLISTEAGNTIRQGADGKLFENDARP